ncbi:nitrogen regulation protein NR(II) [Thermodesulfobacteriota bacterium]
MRTKMENEYLLKAMDAFQRRLLVVAPDFKILAANIPVDELPGSGAIGNTCHKLFYDRSSPCENCAVLVAMESRSPSLRPKPDSFIVQGRMPCFYAYPIMNGDSVEAYVSMDFQIPAIGILEEKLHRTNSLLENLLQSAVDCVIAADMKGNIFLFNASAEEVFGYTKEKAINALNVRDIYPGDGARLVMKLLRNDDYGGKGRLKTYHTNALSKSGEEIPISLYASIIYEDGREIASIGFFHDLRDRIQIQKELENTQLQLLQSEKMASLGKLAAGVAHQINNPLGGITLFAKLMLEEYTLEKDAQEDLHRILRDAERARNTVKELLEFTRQTRHLMQPNNINDALTRTLFLLENQTLFQNIDLQKDFQPDLPPVSSDAQQLYHLMMNIILNAAQAMEGNGVLALKTYYQAKQDRVCIKISDTGPGIPEEALPHIFEPFFTTKDEGKGTGLGLSLAYNIVKSHGGRMSARNNPEKGASFIIELPSASKDQKGDWRE